MDSSKILNPSERSIVESALGSSCNVHAATIARLYKAPEGNWAQVCLGAAAIITETKTNTHYLKVVDLTSKTISFSQQLYENFEYENPRPFFHTFEIDDCVAGFSFADEREANQFYTKVIQCTKNENIGVQPSPRIADPPSRPTSFAVPSLSLPTAPSSASVSSAPPTPTSSSGSLTPTSSHAPLVKKDSTKQKKKGLWSNFKTLVGADDGDEDELIVSEPSNFRHESSIGWSKDTGFEIRNIPPEWRKLFQAAGIKKSELKDKDTAAFVMNIIEKEGGLESMGTPGPAPPLPPKNKQPPPPPPVKPNPPPPPASGGAPPPLPPPNAPPPPSAPSPPNLPPPAAASTPAAPPPSASSGNSRGDLLAAIQKGTQLKHVDPSDASSASAASPPPTGLADTLARAMEARRGAIKGAVEEEHDDSDWSD